MKKILLVATFAMCTISLTAQNVGINTTGATGAASAGLDVDFNDKGILIPRVALSSSTVFAPVTGGAQNSLMVYNTATSGDVTPGFYYWSTASGAWVRFAEDGDAWRLTGNAGTTFGTNFVGTTNLQGLDFRTNDLIRMRIGQGGPVWVNNAVPFAGTVYSIFATGADNGIIADALNGNAISGQVVGGGGDALVGVTTGAGAALFANSQGSGEAIIGFNSGTARTTELVTSNAANNEITLGVFNDGTGRSLNVQSNNTGNTQQTIFAGQNTTSLSTNAAAIWGQTDGTRGGVFLASRVSGSTWGLTGQYIGGGFADAFGVIGISQPNNGWGIGGQFQGNWRGIVGFGGPGAASAVHAVGSITATGPKFFEIDHPLDPENKVLRHANIESNEILNHYRGNVELDANGEATVELPEYFEEININFSYHLTPVGAPAPNLYISEEVSGNSFKIAGGNAGMKVSWTVQAERNDMFIQAFPETKNMEFDKKDIYKGKYYDPSAYGLPIEEGVFYQKPYEEKLNNEQKSNSSIDRNPSLEGERESSIQSNTEVESQQ
jgi:hypothetical protein